MYKILTNVHDTSRPLSLAYDLYNHRTTHDTPTFHRKDHGNFVTNNI